MRKDRLILIKNEEGVEIIQCLYCGDFKPAHHNGACYCNSCTQSHKRLLENREALTLAENYAEEEYVY